MAHPNILFFSCLLPPTPPPSPPDDIKMKRYHEPASTVMLKKPILSDHAFAACFNGRARMLVEELVAVNTRCASCAERFCYPEMTPERPRCTFRDTVLCRRCRWVARYDGQFTCGSCTQVNASVCLTLVHPNAHDGSRGEKSRRKTNPVVFACERCRSGKQHAEASASGSTMDCVTIDIVCRIGQTRSVHPDDPDDAALSEVLHMASHSMMNDRSMNRRSGGGSLRWAVTVRSPATKHFHAHLAALEWDPSR